MFEDESHYDRQSDGEQSGNHHLFERRAGNYVDASRIIGLGGAGHDSRIFAELIAHILNHHLGCPANGFDG